MLPHWFLWTSTVLNMISFGIWAYKAIRFTHQQRDALETLRKAQEAAKKLEENTTLTSDLQKLWLSFLDQEMPRRPNVG